MKRCLISILSVIALLSPTGCIEPIEFTSSDADLPVYVYCVLQNTKRDKAWTIRDPEQQILYLEYVGGVNSLEKKYVEDAEISVTEVDTWRTYKFEKAASGKWEASFITYPGKSYSLSVKIPGYDEITATTTVPQEFLASCYTSWFSKGDEDYSGFSYELRKVIKQSPYQEAYNDSCKLWIFGRGKVNDDKYGDLIMTDHPYVDNFNVTSIRLSDIDTFSSDSLDTYSLYRWLDMAWYPKIYGDFPMHRNFLRIAYPENFTNGASRYEIEHGPLYSERSFVLATEFRYSSNTFMYGNQLVQGPDNPSEQYLFDFYCLSEDLDRYLRDVEERELTSSFDLTSKYNSTNTYSNIEGGIGVFGAYVLREASTRAAGY